MFAASPVAMLATVSADGAPIWCRWSSRSTTSGLHAVDAKRKSTQRLRRLANIRQPKVTMLVDHYDDDWTQLWWVRATGWIDHYSGEEMAAATPCCAGNTFSTTNCRLDGPSSPSKYNVGSWQADIGVLLHVPGETLRPWRNLGRGIPARSNCGLRHR